MTEILPHSGIMKGKIHYFPIRVYYEDTDVGGVVYYANYLKYMERARSEMLRTVGIDQALMLDYNKSDDVSFVVRHAEVDFKKSAVFDDSLIIKTEIIRLGGASVTMKQEVYKNEASLVEAIIKIAVIGKNGKPKRLSEKLKKNLS